jgi:hypothetical protein
MRSYASVSVVFGVALAIGWACGDGEGDESSPDMAGEVCQHADDCYDDVDHEDLHGEVRCLDRVESGYCTHLCQTDADCCAVDGECRSDLHQVCAPFESTGMMMCFLSCEAADVEDDDPDAYCHEHAHDRFQCRSSGGGSANRKVCTPPG